MSIEFVDLVHILVQRCVTLAKKVKQAGAELCQARGNPRLAMLLLHLCFLFFFGWRFRRFGLVGSVW